MAVRLIRALCAKADTKSAPFLNADRGTGVRSMMTNVGTVDQGIRLVLGAALIAAALSIALHLYCICPR